MQKYILTGDKNKVIAGTTLKVNNQPESFNMALHACQDQNAVMENRKHFASDFDIDVHQFVFAQQTHSDHVVKVGKEDQGKGAFAYETGIADCDALYTKDTNVCLGVFHADCVPVLMHDPINQLVVAIHAGWQGTVKEITAKTIAYLKEHENVDPKNLRVYIGPAITQSSFEVGDDVVALVKKMSFDTSNYIYHKEGSEKSFVDNKGLNLRQCFNEGVLAENINMDKNNTYSNSENFFSYRRDKNCGRHMSFIMMKGE